MTGFKNFILRGNLVELAVAFIIGRAFAAVVTAPLTNLGYRQDRRPALTSNVLRAPAGLPSGPGSRP